MKFIVIICGKLRDFVRHRTLVFVLMCLGILASDLMFIYFGGNVKQFFVNDSAPVYTVSSPAGRIDLSALTHEAYVRRIMDLDLYVPLTAEMLSGNTDEWFGLSEYLSTYGEGVIRVRKDFTGMGAAKGKLADLTRPCSMTVPETLSMEKNEFAPILVNGVAVQVVGATIMDVFMMSYDNMTALGLAPSDAAVRLDPRTTAKEEALFCRTLRDTYGLTVQKEETVLDTSDLRREILRLLVMYLTSMFALIYIMIYLTESYSYELNIYRLCGASHEKLIWILGAVSDAVLFAAGGVAVLLHRLLYQPLFRKINLLEVVRYSAADYLLILILTVLLNHLIMSCCLRVKLKRSIVESARRLRD